MQSQENRTFGGRLRNERHRLGLTQVTLAHAGRVSKTTQIAYESGTHFPGVDYLERIGGQGVDLVYLVTGQKTAEFVDGNFNWKLFEEIWRVIEVWESRRKRAVPLPTKIKIARVLYRNLCAAGIFDPVVAESILALAS